MSFWLRSRALIGLRVLRNVFEPGSRCWSAGEALAHAPVRAWLRTPLWADGRDEEFVLVAGKVHNLRIAALAFNGVVVPAGATLSFWRQLGRPNRRRGFVIGREVRAGCVIPALAGGICQLSNALATCAQQAGFALVERHAHGARTEQAIAPKDGLDATVFWNYVDLRIRAPVRWRLDVSLDGHELRVDIRSEETLLVPPSVQSDTGSVPVAASPAARSCSTCDETSCFRHRSGKQALSHRSVWLLDACTPELRQWLLDRDEAAELFLPVPSRQLLRWLLRLRPPDGNWTLWAIEADRRLRLFGWPSLRRAVWLRVNAQRPGRRQANIVNGQGWLAQAYSRALRPEHTDLVVDQGLLPQLWLQGALGGRSYDVLATALPMQEIERRLDRADALHAGNTAARTLVDFRVRPVLAQAELSALRGARRIVTAHADVADYWRQRGLTVLELPWQMPLSPRRPAFDCKTKPLLVFPASALARKGAYELAAALRGLSVQLLVLGTPSDDVALWKGLDVIHGCYAEDWVSRADLVVLPAHVEHAPRALLRAISAGLPVIATSACGVRGEGVVRAVAGDVENLRATIIATLGLETSVLATHATAVVPT
ncbi:VanW family protein [Dyella agri]